MVSVQKNKKSAAGRRHEQQSTVREGVLPERAGTIAFAHPQLLLHRATVERAEVQVAANVVVDIAVLFVRCIEDTMDDKVCEGEEHAGDATGMLLELVALQ